VRKPPGGRIVVPTPGRVGDAHRQGERHGGSSAETGGGDRRSGRARAEAGITADDLADYTFRIGVEGNVPALVPLSGEVPPVDYPMPLDIPATVDSDLIGGSGTLRAIEAEILLDYGEERADEDTRILALTGEVHVTDNGAGGTAYVNPDDLGISVDGIRVEQIDAETPPATADLPAGATASATWVFVIPAGGKAGVLHFGSDSPDDAKGAAFTLPELP
jgi:hypothetical protein